MSAALIRQALETGLNGIAGSVPTAWENVPYEPTTGTAWQEAFMLHATPRPLEMSGKWHDEVGVLQVNLHYPLNTGSAAAETRAELVRSTFKHGSEFTASGVTVRVSNTPSIARIDDDDWHSIAVSIPFSAFIARS